MTKMMKKRFLVLCTVLAVCAGACTAGSLGLRARAAEATDVIDPFVWYQFQDATDLGKDTMGRYNLKTEGTVTTSDRGAVFDGKSRLYAPSEESDVSETLTSFTMNFEMTPGTQTGVASPIGFGWNDWTATKYCRFTLNEGEKDSDGNDMFRFTTQGDGSPGGRDWGPELGRVVAGTTYQVSLTAQLGGNVAVYVNGVKKYDKPLAEDWNLKDTNMRFAIGSDCIFSHGGSYSPYVGEINNVSIYSFSMTADEITAYNAAGALKATDLTAKVSAAEADFSDTIIAEEGATDEEILLTVPKTSLLPVTMSDTTSRKATVQWTGVVHRDTGVFLEGTITDVVNPDAVKVYAKIGVQKADLILPVAKYDFADAQRPGKDAMGNYDLKSYGAVSSGTDGVSLSESLLYANVDESGNDFSDLLNSATISLKFRIDEFSPDGWWCLFSTDDYYAKKTNVGLSLMVQSSDGNLRVKTPKDGWWGPVLVQLVKGTLYQVDIVQDLAAHKMHAYVNGELKASVELPDDFSLSSAKHSMFSIGGACDGGENDQATEYIAQKGKVTFRSASVYDFAMNATQVTALYNTGVVKSNSFAGTPYLKEIATEPVFSGEVTNRTLLDKMTEAEMLAAINAATVTGTLSDAASMSVPVVWERIVHEGETWQVEGRTKLIGLSVPCSAESVKVVQTLTVVPAFGITVSGDIINGKVTVSAGSGIAGDVITVTAAPNEHYTLKQITANGSPIGAVSGEYRITVADQDVVISAEFEAIVYGITVGDVEHGTLVPAAENGIAGQVVEITVTPDAHYTLSKLFANGEQVLPEGGKYRITISGDMVLTAEFVEAVYTVDVIPGANGQVKVDATSGKAGETVTITITPNAHYRIVKVTVNGSEISASAEGYSFVIDGDSEVAVTFGKIEQKVAVEEPGAGGTVQVDKESAGFGEKVTVTVTPDKGYSVGRVLVNGVELQPENGVYTITVAEEDILVTAEFIKEAASTGWIYGVVFGGIAVIGGGVAAFLLIRKKKKIK